MQTVRQNPFDDVAQALVRSGYRSLDAQAQALGLSRSTAWTIIKGKHKRGRLHLTTACRILANPNLPAQVRAVMEAYAASVDLDTSSRSGDRVQRINNASATD